MYPPVPAHLKEYLYDSAHLLSRMCWAKRHRYNQITVKPRLNACPSQDNILLTDGVLNDKKLVRALCSVPD